MSRRIAKRLERQGLFPSKKASSKPKASNVDQQ